MSFTSYCFERSNYSTGATQRIKETLQLEECRRTNKRILQEKPSKLQRYISQRSKGSALEQTKMKAYGEKALKTCFFP
jgi:hypothetical protein